MIHFFRRIRQGLLSQNRFSKYLLYAIGEILLVVVGILIALSINNWNEERKQKRTMINYYQQLLEAFKLDTTDIRPQLNRLAGSMAKYKAYMDGYNKPNLTIEQVLENINQIDPTFKTIEFNTQTIKVLENTGEIKFFPQHIKNKLINLKNNISIYQKSSPNRYDFYMNMRNKTIILRGVASSIGNVLANQKPLAKALSVEKNFAYDIAVLHEAFDMKNFAERNDVRQLNEISSLMLELISLILKELK